MISRFMRVVLAVALGASALTVIAASPARASGGPVVLTGIDAEDCGPNGHGPIQNYAQLVNSILGNTANGGDGILVIGANTSGTNSPQSFWNAIGSGTGEAITFGDATDSFAGFQMIAVVGSAPETCGGLTATQNSALISRQADVANFINSGGGLLGNTQSNFASADQYAYIGGLGTFASQSAGYSNIDPTPDGLAVGITDALDLCCWHNVFTQFPSFLTPLAFRAGTQQVAAIGGAQVTIGIDLSPGSATNPVGSPHTVTATVSDSAGNPAAGTNVTFAVVSGPNAGTTGTCDPASCDTDSTGQVHFTYTGLSGGQDTIEACFTNDAGDVLCATATKDWINPVTVSIDDVSGFEGDAGTTPFDFTVSLSQPAPVGGASVMASTADGTASAGADYQAEPGVVISFAPGEQSQTLPIAVIGDLVDEADEAFLVNLSSPVGASIADGQGTGTILDDERNGTFSCRATALRVTGIERSVANPPDDPCADDSDFLAQAGVNTGGFLTPLVVGSTTLVATTDQTPDDLEATAPAVGDDAVATASLEQAQVSALNTVGISATGISATATVECMVGPSGAVEPALSGSSTLASLTINGQVIDADEPMTIPLLFGLGSVEIHRTVVTADSITQQALRVVVLGMEVVVGEARADFSGNPCDQ